MSLTLNEMGLDFRVALADDVEGVPWVLRIPRRPEVLARVADEARILAFLQVGFGGPGDSTARDKSAG